MAEKLRSLRVVTSVESKRSSGTIVARVEKRFGVPLEKAIFFVDVAKA